jgi:hypothetical protein
VVSLRFPFRLAEPAGDGQTPRTWSTPDAALDSAHLGGVDDIEEEGEEMCVYLIGRKLDEVVDVARQALARFAVPSGGYALFPLASTKVERVEL